MAQEAVKYDGVAWATEASESAAKYTRLRGKLFLAARAYVEQIGPVHHPDCGIPDGWLDGSDCRCDFWERDNKLEDEVLKLAVKLKKEMAR